jgi:Flp pilus assembly pilin Flp
MRSVRESLHQLLTRTDDGEDHLLEYVVILVLIALVAILALVFLGDLVADLISLIGGRVDEATVVE